MHRKIINKIIREFEKHFPEKKQKKKATSILDTLIATKLSQNTTDKSAIIAFQNLKDIFKSWDDLIDAPLSLIKKQIKVCGLADTKSKDLKNMLVQMKKEKGKLDLSYLKKMSNEEVYNDLLKYNGIGVKTVSCVLAFALNRDVFPVDTHVHRVLNRLGIVKTKSAEDTFEEAKTIISDKKKVFLHRAVIMFGRNICKAKNPICGICYLYDYCEFEEKENFVENKTKMKENNFLILDKV